MFRYLLLCFSVSIFAFELSPIKSIEVNMGDSVLISEFNYLNDYTIQSTTRFWGGEEGFPELEIQANLDGKVIRKIYRPSTYKFDCGISLDLDWTGAWDNSKSPAVREARNNNA